MAATTNKVAAIDYSIVNKAVTKANKNKSINQHKEAAKLARKAAKKATEEGNYHLANHYHKIYEHHNEMANMRKSETKDNPRDMGKNYNDEGGASEHIPTHLKQLQTKADAYHKAGDIESANALRDKIEAIKTKHNMAPVSTQKSGTSYYKPTQKSEVLSKTYKEEDIVHENHPFAVLKHDKGHYKVIHNLGTHSMVVGNYHLPDKPEYALQRAKDNADERASLVKEGKYPHMNPSYYNKPHEKSETETRLAILAKGLKAAITLRGLVKAEKLDKASGLSPENQLKFTQNRAFSASDNANQSNDKTAHSYAKDFHNKSAEVANKVGKPHVAEYHRAIAKHHEEVANNPNDYQITKPSGHTGLSPENKIKYSQNRADSSTEIAHGSNDATHHSNAAHFHRKASEVASSVGHKVLANYHNNIAKYHENESSGGGNK